ncbi:hypothetical protein CPBF424_37350 [Xanthomonas euroxanthea]|uniref:Uncharacterized protein n=2 Tax=Xanthomonas euroxanthea TaxID=2259622 RepID=A0AA46CBD9_9XANT|nr:hypothetical protein CPBF424_37350 [Xanthomonas euroxanthea]
MRGREKAVWAAVYARYSDDPSLGVTTANQAVPGFRIKELDGPQEEVWVKPNRKFMLISFEEWKVWYPISYKIQYKEPPSPEKVAADYEAFVRGRTDFW